jgi:prepilin-type processing-associated H-X9-DG protein
VSVLKDPAPLRWGFGKGIKLVQITDGSSNTVMLSEIYAFDHVQDARGLWIWPGMGGNAFTTKFPPNSPGNDVMGGCPPTPMPAGMPAELNCVRNRSNGNVWAAARSKHMGGVNAALADGSVRFISNSIVITIWQAIGSIAGGEPTGDF